jgi:periplasmic protein TonB
MPSGGALQTGLPPANDRMLTTMFLAALLHGIVILGVTFSSANKSADNDAAPGLEVILVNDRAPAASSNPDAHYLSQRTQRGSGNTAKREHARIPKSSLMPVDRLGIPNGEGSATAQAAADDGEDELLSTRSQSSKIFYFANASPAKEASQLPLLLEKRPDLAMTSNDDGVELRMRGEAKQELWIAADTRASDVAVYLDSWRRKIERVGTMNFPDIARQKKLSGTPVIEVTIGVDGTLLNTVVRRSSGHAEIDQAAMRILKLAAPYDPFSSELAGKHDEIRIAYEWQFLGSGAVFYTEPGQR